MSPVILRPAAKSDASVLHGLLKKMARELGKICDFTGTVASIEAAGFADKPAFYAIIAWRGDEAVGFILYFYEYSTWTATRGIYIQDLYVDASARGEGLAHRLTCAAAILGNKDCNAGYLRLTVHDNNDTGINFYHKMGFKSMNDETIMTLKGDSFQAALQHVKKGALK